MILRMKTSGQWVNSNPGVTADISYVKGMTDLGISSLTQSELLCTTHKSSQG